MGTAPHVKERTLLHKGFGTLERIVFGRRRRDGDPVELTREVFDTGDGVCVLPYDAERGIIVLVRQFRGVAFLHDGRDNLLEACAGKLQGAEPLTRIVKELEEETGIRLAGEPRRLFSGYASPSSFTERLTFFAAPFRADDRVGRGGGLVDEGEDIEVVETTIAEAIALVERGEIIDMKTIALLYWARASGLMAGLPEPLPPDQAA
jgi:nudix-type nucleoside diphosphatase (YffH/AdpP family)